MTIMNLPNHFIRTSSGSELSRAIDYCLTNANGLIITQTQIINQRQNVQNKFSELKMPFLVDPDTFRYFIDPRYHHRRGNPRAWHLQMLQNFPDEIKNSFTKRPAYFKKFRRIDIESFCKECLEIQTSLVDDNDNKVLPLGIMVPYYIIESGNFTQQLLEHITLSNTMLNINNTDLPVITMLHLDRSILRSIDNIQLIVSAVGAIPVSGVAVWIDGFDEATATVVEVENLKNLYSGINEAGKSTIAMYGGIGQILLMRTGLTSVCHGTHYQLDRTAFRDGGGPGYYFYIPPLRRRMQNIDARAFISRQNIANKEEYQRKICSCSICERFIAPGPDYVEAINTLESNRNTEVEVIAGHFTECIKNEIYNALNMTKEQLEDWLVNEPLKLNLTQDEVDHVEDTIKDTWLSQVP